jgi:hypothetical protein
MLRNNAEPLISRRFIILVFFLAASVQEWQFPTRGDCFSDCVSSDTKANETAEIFLPS